MATPQQPDLARSGRSAADPKSAKARVDSPPDTGGPAGPVPEDNRPGHQPAADQDKPTGPPPRPRTTGRGRRARLPRPADVAAATVDDGSPQRFAFAFEPRVLPFSLAVGVNPLTSWVEVGADRLEVRFGLWHLETPLDNVVGVELTGPYSLLKVAGPAHVSFSDGGVTFATSTRQGACVRLRQPVPALLPVQVVRHQAATVTVQDPEALAGLLRRRAGLHQA